jgi:DNA polymerase III epsilon subunit family exonuclease
MLRARGGRASAVKIVDYVMKIRKPEPSLARLLVSDLVERDPRLKLNEDHVELVNRGHETRVLADTDFVVFDLETTGSKTPPCRITEIGAYRVQGGRITAEFQTLVNPEMRIPPFISLLTGITDEMVKDAPKFADVVCDFLDFIGDAVLVAHNAPFDMRFLNYEIGRIFEEYRVGNSYLCTVQLSRKLISNIDNHKLKTLAEYYAVSLVNHHRAPADAYATAQIFVNLLDALDGGGFRDFGSVKKLGLRKGLYVG